MAITLQNHWQMFFIASVALSVVDARPQTWTLKHSSQVINNNYFSSTKHVSFIILFGFNAFSWKFLFFFLKYRLPDRLQLIHDCSPTIHHSRVLLFQLHLTDVKIGCLLLRSEITGGNPVLWWYVC